MYLRYHEQDCGLTLREGIAEYHAYLEAIGRKAMVDRWLRVSSREISQKNKAA